MQWLKEIKQLIIKDECIKDTYLENTDYKELHEYQLRARIDIEIINHN